MTNTTEPSGQHTAGDIVRARCVSCGQTTTWVYRQKRSMLGLKTMLGLRISMMWGCAGCGTEQPNEPAAD